MNKFYRGMKKLFGGLFKILFRVKIVNPEKEIKGLPYVVCCNHTSLFDVVVISLSMETQVSYMAKKEVFKVPLLRHFVKAMGAFPVDRKKGDVAAIKKTIEVLKDGGCVGIFPQGTRCPRVDPATTRVKSGVGLIAARSGADVLPVCVKSNVGAIKMFRKNYIIIGDLIKNEEFDFENNKGAESHQAAADRIHAEICKLYRETDIKNAE